MLKTNETSLLKSKVLPYRIVKITYYFCDMVEMQGLTLGQLADLYDASSDEEKLWMSDNIGSGLNRIWI